MKAKELMIGDWVAFLGDPYQYTANDIASMAECEAKGIPTNTTPIPLTHEIITSNGFELIEVGDNGPGTPRKNVNRYEKWICKTTWIDIQMWYDRLTKDWCLHGVNSVKLKNVHELQHAMRLCGIKKEIIL